VSELPYGLPPAVRIIHHPALPSTSTEALRLAMAGEPGRFWVATDDQTAGRGRSGRRWQSTPGNLYASCLIPLRCSVGIAQQLSLVAGVAAIDAITSAVGEAGHHPPLGLCLKWPNDIMIDTAKMGGILVETTTHSRGDGLFAVVGMGLNLAGHPRELERPATDLAVHGTAITPAAMLRALAWSLEEQLAIWDEGAGLANIRSAWLVRGMPIGTPLRIHNGAAEHGGEFAGLDESGALLLRHPTGRIDRFTWGDVTLPAEQSVGAQ
jgi:BirA family biotin operon repressor/biotin-[acetyl-CoA-carboxylase] ligase